MAAPLLSRLGECVSDYLTSLAVRSLGGAETITPRLPARFEPLTAAAPPKDSLGTDERDWQPQGGARSSDAPVPRLPTGATVAEPRSLVSSLRDLDPPPRATWESERTAVVPAPIRAWPAPRPDPLAAVSLSVHGEPEIPRASEPDHRGLPGALVTPVGPPRPPAAAAETASTPVASPHATVFAPAGALRPVPTPSESRLTAAAPTIRITIGRVDVRAVTPPAPTSRPAPAPPQPLSLDDYAKQREGRR
jgi:hypothetical protein